MNPTALIVPGTGRPDDPLILPLVDARLYDWFDRDWKPVSTLTATRSMLAAYPARAETPWDGVPHLGEIGRQAPYCAPSVSADDRERLEVRYWRVLAFVAIELYRFDDLPADITGMVVGTYRQLLALADMPRDPDDDDIDRKLRDAMTGIDDDPRLEARNDELRTAINEAIDEVFLRRGATPAEPSDRLEAASTREAM